MNARIIPVTIYNKKKTKTLPTEGFDPSMFIGSIHEGYSPTESPRARQQSYLFVSFLKVIVPGGKVVGVRVLFTVTVSLLL